MISTRDGHVLSVDDECLMVTFKKIDVDDDGWILSEYIESLTKCIYKGSWLRGNKQFITSFPSAETLRIKTFWHRFERVGDTNEKFDLLTHEVKNTVIMDMSSVEEVVEKRFKCKN